MKKSEYFSRSLVNAAGVFIYVSAVTYLLFNGEKVFGKVQNFIMPLFMLLLLIISASITGLLVLGKPIQLYLDGLKKEALILFFSTLMWLIFFGLLVLLILLLS